MKKTILPVSFFYGANRQSGYCSLYSELYNPFEKGNHIILKGGPGTGKSTLMKKIAKKLELKGYYVERGYCSADPLSLDAVVAPEINFSIFDGTAPHVFDPTLPGISEHIVNLGVAWDNNYLNKYIGDISELQKRNSSHHKKAASFLRVASQIETEGALICARFTDEDKLDRYVSRLCARYIPENKGAGKGRVMKRFLSGVTPEGVTVQHNTVVALAERIFTIEDEYSAVSSYIMERLCSYATDCGYDVYKCVCPLQPDFKTEHIIIPQLKLAFFTQNSYHFSINGQEQCIHASRFYDKPMYGEQKEKLKLYKKAKREFIDEAVNNIAAAKRIHDSLEDYYVNATNFDVINEISEKILNEV